MEQWRTIVANTLMHDVRAQVSLSVFLDFENVAFRPLERREGELDILLGQLVSLTAVLKALRQ